MLLFKLDLIDKVLLYIDYYIKELSFLINFLDKVLLYIML